MSQPRRAFDALGARSVNVTETAAKQPVSKRHRPAASEVRAIMDSAVDAIVTADERGVIRSFNRAAERLFGYRPQEAIGQPISLLMPEPDRSRHQQYIERYLATGDAHIIGIGREVEAQRKDGSRVPIYLAVSEFQVDGERRFAAVLHDISADLEVRELRERLAQAEGMSALVETTATLAHELNQPLAAIATYAQAAHVQATGDDAKKLLATLDKVVEQALRAGAVVKRVQGLVKGVAGDSERFEEADVNALLAGVAALARTDAQRQGVRVSFEASAPLPAVRCDPVQIQQVVLNLLRNGVDAIVAAGRAHGDVVRIHARRADGAVRICVEDSGSGVAADAGEAVFEPFHTNKPDGMGLGLAICGTIVAKHGGSLGFRNNAPAPGATFHFTLPLAARLPDDE